MRLYYEYQWEITGPLFSFYERKHGVKFTELTTAEEALTLFAGSARGYVVWDPAVAATMNAAFTIAGLEDALVVTPHTEPLLDPPVRRSGWGSWKQSP